MHKLALLVTATLFVAGAAACSPVNVSDQGPPTVTWSVLDQTTRQNLTAAAVGTLTLDQGDSVQIFVHAQSPGGVKTVQASGWGCVRPTNGGQGKRMNFPAQTSSQIENSSGKAGSTLVEIFTINPLGVCNSNPPGGSFSAIASNFFSKSATGSLAIKVAIPIDSGSGLNPVSGD